MSTKTESKQQMKRALKLAARADEPPYPPGVLRPTSRSECIGMPRPCPFVSCSEHLYFRVKELTGNLIFNFAGVEPEQMIHSCYQDAIEKSVREEGMTLEEIGSVMGLTRERVRQVEETGKEKMKAHGIDLDAIYKAT